MGDLYTGPIKYAKERINELNDTNNSIIKADYWDLEWHEISGNIVSNRGKYYFNTKAEILNDAGRDHIFLGTPKQTDKIEAIIEMDELTNGSATSFVNLPNSEKNRIGCDIEVKNKAYVNVMNTETEIYSVNGSGLDLKFIFPNMPTIVYGSDNNDNIDIWANIGPSSNITYYAGNGNNTVKIAGSGDGYNRTIYANKGVNTIYMSMNNDKTHIYSGGENSFHLHYMTNCVIENLSNKDKIIMETWHNQEDLKVVAYENGNFLIKYKENIIAKLEGNTNLDSIIEFNDFSKKLHQIRLRDLLDSNSNYTKEGNEISEDENISQSIPDDYEGLITNWKEKRFEVDGSVPLNPWFNPEQWKDPRGYIEAKKAQHKIEVFNAGKTFFTDVDSVEETKKGLQGLVPLLEAISKTTSKVNDDKDVDIFNDLNQILGDLTRLADIYGRDIPEEEKRKEIGKVAANISQSSLGMLNNVLKKWNEDEFLQDKPKFIGNPAVTGGLSILSSTIGLASSLAVACDGWDDKTAKEKASDYVNVLNNAFDLALDGIQTVEKTKEAYQISHGLLNVASQEVKMGVWTPLDIWASIGKGAIEGLVQFSESYSELKNDNGHMDTRDWGVTGIQTSMAGFKGILGSLTFGLDELVFGEDYEKKTAEHIINTSESIGTALGVTIVYGKDVIELASMVKNNLISVFTNNG